MSPLSKTPYHSARIKPKCTVGQQDYLPPNASLFQGSTKLEL